jgi:hypothetical protein
MFLPAAPPAINGAAPTVVDEPTMRIDEPTPPRPRSQPKTNASTAWAAWQAEPDSTDSTAFLEIVASWTDGTTAQLMRAPWPEGRERPTAATIRDRLRHHIVRAASGPESSYVAALEQARNDVIAELQHRPR